jgi:hypothetical protein
LSYLRNKGIKLPFFSSDTTEGWLKTKIPTSLISPLLHDDNYRAKLKEAMREFNEKARRVSANQVIATITDAFSQTPAKVILNNILNDKMFEKIEYS